MSGNINAHLTRLLWYVFMPYLSPPENPAESDVVRRETLLSQIPNAEYQMASELFREFCPPYRSALCQAFDHHAAVLREEVHHACRGRGEGRMTEISEFYIRLRPLVSQIFSTERVLQGGRSYRTLSPFGEPVTARLNDMREVEMGGNSETEEDDDSEDNAEEVAGRNGDKSNVENWRRTRRRKVDGDCSICFEPLNHNSIPTQMEVCEQKLGNVSLNGGKTGNHHDTDNEGVGGSLVWCKAFCGVNYHRECFDKWVSRCVMARSMRSVTCPTCRRVWWGT
ncbi:uncharacterized protein BJX67DRAFT_377171 [Aspergillus lucknowensis]|uniref:RING-type domain-containing protein n=1 Tax=Aspergillus lucknowensis TaxID=176173 RepID=A0ABR4M492_9EURO